MKRTTIIAITFFMGACGDVTQIKPDRYVHPDLTELVDQFRADAEARQVDTSAGFGKLRIINFVDSLVTSKKVDGSHSRAIGVCKYYKSKYVRGVYWREIYLERSVYEKTIEKNPKFFEALVYHELGHCVLDLEHVTKWSSIMHSKVPPFSSEKFKVKWPEMVDELFEMP